MDEEVVPAAGSTGPAVLEPPPGSGVPQDTDPAPAPTPAPASPAPTVKLPPSIKPPVKKPGGSGRFQERISDLVSQRDSERRENASLRERMSRMKPVDRPGEGPVTGKAGTALTTRGEGVLHPDDFETYQDYIQALVDKTVEQREQAGNSARENKAQEDHKAERTAIFNAQAAPLAEEYGDGFWDAITDPTLPISEAMADAVMELDELGPFIMLYLAAHKDEAAKVARMNPRAATVAIGKLAAKLDFEIRQGATPAEAVEAVDGGGGTPAQAPTAVAQPPAAPRPTPVPTPRGTVPALSTDPSDKDSVDVWLQKETDRMRRRNPNGQFYGAR
jgi:hypothetical protein